jgi:hypothetical protein
MISRLLHKARRQLIFSLCIVAPLVVLGLPVLSEQSTSMPLAFAPEDICGPSVDSGGAPLPEYSRRTSVTDLQSTLLNAEFNEDPAPFPSGSAAQDNYVAVVMATPDPAAHADSPGKMREHDALLALVPRSEATNVAVANGSWFATETWHDGRIPGQDARVLIPEGIAVLYDGQGDAPLFTVRIDGALQFAPDKDSRITVDTLVVAPTGLLQIGTAASPVRPDVRAEVLINGKGDIDLAWDPMLLSRGVISLGQGEIHGVSKTAFLKVGTAPKRGDRQLQLASIPEGWRIGDRLVVSGTLKQGWAWDNDAAAVVHHESQDEVVTITAIDGATVTLDRSLRYNHYAPRKDLAAYVANVTRNIVFASLDGDATPLSQRGHVMFMHSDAVDVRYAAFEHLGRTDKSAEASDLSALAEVAPTSNIKGRYPLHLHKTGMASPDAPAMVVGNVVFDSPGWGYVHHSSNADFIDNVAFDVFGAAFAAEDGDETGIWLRNMAIRAKGFDWGDVPAKSGLERHDNGRTGDGFFFAGRLVEAAENVAINTTHGFVWMHRSAPSGPLPETVDHPEIAYGKPRLEPDDAPIQGFRNNEAFGTEIGLMVIKQNSEQGHDVRSVLDGFINWETRKGVDISYTAHYTFLNFDLRATERTEVFAPDTGFNFGANAFDIVINRMSVEGFPVGVNLNQGFTYPFPDSDVGYVLIDVAMTDVKDQYPGFNAARHRLLTGADLSATEVAIVQTEVAIAPDQDLPLAGDKQDSLGATPRQKAGDLQTIYRWEVPDLLRSTGYMTTSDGRRLALIPDFVADRATGKLMKHSYIVQLNISDEELQSWGATDNGPYDPQNAAPVSAADTVSTTANEPISIDVLANDTDPEADLLLVEGVTDPVHGEVLLQADGKLLYRPNLGFAGEDQFTYWASDGAGNYTPAAVHIKVALR